MCKPSLRDELRAALVRLGATRAFTDAQDVFATSIVRSINLLELICFLEDTYRIEITQRDIFDGHLRSIDRMAAFVEGARKETP